MWLDAARYNSPKEPLHERWAAPKSLPDQLGAIHSFRVEKLVRAIGTFRNIRSILCGIPWWALQQIINAIVGLLTS